MGNLLIHSIFFSFFQFLLIFKKSQKNIIKKKLKIHDTEEKKFKNIEKDSAIYKSLQTPLKYTPDFDFKGVQIPEKIKMFFPNPEPNWGPKGKAAQQYIFI